MKILFLNYHYDVEGIGRGASAQVRSIAAALETRGHQVDLRFQATKKGGAAAGEQREPKIIGWLRRYGHVPKHLLLNIPLARGERRIIDETCPDVVMAISSFCKLSALRAARSRRIPFVLFSEAPMEYEYSMFFTEYYRYPKISRWIEGINVRRADRVICISDVLKGYLMRYGPRATRLHVVPNGVDHDLFKPRPPDEELRELLQLRDRIVVGYVGNFLFLPDAQRLAGAIKAVCNSRPEATFLFVGEGEGGRELRRAAEELGIGERLVFVGAVDHAHVPRYISLMDVGICPYRGDFLFYGSALKPLEYMASGLPVVAPALGQIKELIVNGRNGLLYRWDDYEAWATRLLSLTENGELRRSLGDMARKTIEDSWTGDLQAERIEHVLQLAAQEYK